MAKGKTKTYKVLDNDGQHEYTIFVKKTKKGNEYAIHTSTGDSWHKPFQNEHILTLTDDGNGVKFSQPLESVDYNVSTAIRILTNFANSNERYTIVKQKIKMKL